MSQGCSAERLRVGAVALPRLFGSATMSRHRKQTRKQRAEELVERLEQGPGDFLDPFGRRDEAEEAKARESYRQWSRCWILPVVRELLAKDLEERNRKR